MANTNSQGNQAISPNRKARTASRGGRAPFFLSIKRQAASDEQQAASVKRSGKLRAASVKQQALNVGPIIKRQARRFAMIAQQT
jgi:hypothetical protein